MLSSLGKLGDNVFSLMSDVAAHAFIGHLAAYAGIFPWYLAVSTTSFILRILSASIRVFMAVRSCSTCSRSLCSPILWFLASSVRVFPAVRPCLTWTWFPRSPTSWFLAASLRVFQTREAFLLSDIYVIGASDYGGELLFFTRTIESSFTQPARLTDEWSVSLGYHMQSPSVLLACRLGQFCACGLVLRALLFSFIASSRATVAFWAATSCKAVIFFENEA